MTIVLASSKHKDVAHAGRLLELGGTVAIPTETVYGLAANAKDPVAIGKVFSAKNRPRQHPLIVHIGKIEQLNDWAIEIPEQAWQLAKAFWPGPLTLLLNRHPSVSPVVTGGEYSIAVRMPHHPALLEILQSTGLAVVAPSANLHQQLSPTSAAHVLQQLDGRIDAVLDGGPCSVGIESTIVDVRQSPATILRPGPISAGDIAAVLATEVITPAAHSESVAGNQQRHYQPHTPLFWWQSEQPLAANEHLLTWQSAVADVAADQQTCLGTTPAAYAQRIYAALAECDAQNYARIWLQPLPQEQAWAPLLNRLERAVHSAESGSNR